MRKIGLILLAVLLTGCSLTTNSIKARVAIALDRASEVRLTMNQNQNKTTYDYYLAPDIGRRESSLSSSVLFAHNANILMNLDIVSVLSDRFYETEGTDPLRKFILNTTPVYQRSDDVLTIDKRLMTYVATISPVENNIVLISLQTRYFLFTAIAPFASAPDLLYDMLVVCRTATISEDQIILLYSNRETINYQKETLDIFSQLAPESGKVIDMISVDSDQPSNE